MNKGYTAQKQHQLSISLITSTWITEARILHTVSVLCKKIRHHEVREYKQNREVACSLSIFISGLYLLLFLQTLFFVVLCVGLSFVLYLSRPRSYSVPPSGEQVRQWCFPKIAPLLHHKMLLWSVRRMLLPFLPRIFDLSLFSPQLVLLNVIILLLMKELIKFKF
jgi:hypothetical protein